MSVPESEEPLTYGSKTEDRDDDDDENYSSTKIAPSTSSTAAPNASSTSVRSTIVDRANEQDTPSSAEAPRSTPTTQATGSNFDVFKLVKEDAIKFIYTPIADDYPNFVRCLLTRDNSGIQKGFFPAFYLHLEHGNDSEKTFLMGARKGVSVTGHAHYLITTDAESLLRNPKGEHFAGKLRSSALTGGEYTLYDEGISPKKSGQQGPNDKQELRRELAAIVYEAHLLNKAPRKFSVMLPKIGQNLQPSQGAESILARWPTGECHDFIPLSNKLPVLDEESKSYQLNFLGDRIKQPSNKNFQLIFENEKQEQFVVMQFGRVDDNTFVCDYRNPLSAIQAFGIALSSFQSRLTPQ